VRGKRKRNIRQAKRARRRRKRDRMDRAIGRGGGLCVLAGTGRGGDRCGTQEQGWWLSSSVQYLVSTEAWRQRMTFFLPWAGCRQDLHQNKMCFAHDSEASSPQVLPWGPNFVCGGSIPPPVGACL
jgi:hypothetical protein